MCCHVDGLARYAARRRSAHLMKPAGVARSTSLCTEAPDIAGHGKANPLARAQLPMMLRYSFGLGDEADMLDQAVANVLRSGIRTADIVGMVIRRSRRRNGRSPPWSSSG